MAKEEVVWLFLREARDLVAKRCGESAPEAERLIIEYAQKGHFKRYRRHRDRSIPPRHWGAMHPEFGLYILVDFDNNTVMHVNAGPSSETTKLMMEDVNERLEKVVELPPPVFQMRLVCLSRDEVLSMLRMEGLLESSEQPAVVVENPQPLMVQERVQERAKARRQGKQEAVLDPLVKELFGEDMPTLRPAELQRTIMEAIKAKSLKKTAPPKHWVPSLEGCKRFLQKRGKLRPAQ
jgi:hypothetical protein